MNTILRWGSLRNKIIAWSFIPTAILLVAVSVVIFFSYQDVTQQLVVERNRRLTLLTADQLSTDLREFTDQLDSVARISDITSYNPNTQREGLKAAANRLALFNGGVFILDSSGMVIAAEPDSSIKVGQDWSDRHYYRQMLRLAISDALGPVVSNISNDGVDGTPVIVLSVPITGEQGQFLGILGGMFQIGEKSVSSLYGNILKLRLGDKGSIFLVDNNGRVIYHSTTNIIGEDFSDRFTVQEVLAGGSDALRILDPDGQDIVTSYAPVPGTSWGYVIQESWSDVISGSQRYQQFLLLLLALGVLIPIVVVSLGVRRITKPIEELIVAAREVARGSFGQTITASTGDEIEVLATQFSLMSAQLQESYTNLEQRVDNRTQELAALNSIAFSVSQSLDLDEILDIALDQTLEVLNIEAGGIYLLDESKQVLCIAKIYGFSQEFADGINSLKLGEGFSGRVAQTGETIVVKDVSSDARLTRFVVQEQGLRSLAVIPMGSSGKVLGTLFAITRGIREFSQQDIQLLTSIGNQIGVAVENARLFEAEQRRAEQFRVIGELGRRMTSILDINDLLVEVVQLIQQSFDYDHVGIALIKGEYVEYIVGSGVLWDDPDFIFKPARLKIGEQGVTGWVASKGEPLLLADVSKDERYIWMQGSKTRSELAVPMSAKGELIGVLDAQSDQLDAFDEIDLVLLQSLANQAAIAFENARLYKGAQQAAVMAERSRLARDLHDSVTQSLYSLTLLAEAGGRMIDSGNKDKILANQARLGDIAQQALQEMRLMVYELRPPILRSEGLVGAIEQRLETVERRAGVDANLHTMGDLKIPEDVEEEYYLIAQEALNNALKHSMIDEVSVLIETSGEHLRMEISDNGRGFDKLEVRNKGGLGLINMQERADEIGAELSIKSEPGEGTQVCVQSFIEGNCS